MSWMPSWPSFEAGTPRTDAGRPRGASRLTLGTTWEHTTRVPALAWSRAPRREERVYGPTAWDEPPITALAQRLVARVYLGSVDAVKIVGADQRDGGAVERLPKGLRRCGTATRAIRRSGSLVSEKATLRPLRLTTRGTPLRSR